MIISLKFFTPPSMLIQEINFFYQFTYGKGSH